MAQMKRREADLVGIASWNITASECNWPTRDQSTLLQDISLPFLALTTLSVAVRVIARLPGFRPPIGSDDYVIILTWVMLLTTL